MRQRMLGMLAAVLLAGAARPAGAQVADSAGLARAVAAVVTDSLIPELGDRNPNYLREGETRFDSAVVALLRTVPGISRSERWSGAHEWVGTRGFVMRGDTAAVLVEWGTHTPGTGSIDTYIQTNWFFFIPEPTGWRFLRREYISGASAGPVRG